VILQYPKLAHPVDYSEAAIKTLSSDYRIEPKYDGIRLITIKDNSDVRFLTRSQRDITEKLQYLRDEFSVVPCNTLLDGELTLSVDGKREELGNIQKVIGSTAARAAKMIEEIGKPIFNVFDVLWYDGKPLQDEPLRRRLWDLEELYMETDSIRPIEEIHGLSIEEAFKKVTGNGSEGIVVKDLNRSYDGSLWVRWKSVNTIDIVVMGFNPPSGRYAGKPVVGSLQGFQFDPVSKSWIKVANIYGLSDVERAQFYEIFKQNPRTKIVVEAKYSHRFPSGRFRFCSFLRVRDDKIALDCTYSSKK
jgi:ATP-dependent DNA ligase